MSDPSKPVGSEATFSLAAQTGGRVPSADAPAASEAPPVPGLILKREIGRGGMGVVYEADELATHKKVALKVLYNPSGELLERFLREAQILKSLEHPDIVRVYDFGRDQQRAWFSMELLSGTELTNVIHDPDLSLVDRLVILIRSARALQHAHEAKVIHRDIKPSNIFVTSEGGVRVLDFGVARLPTSTLTATGFVVGTPRYMAPEQSQGDKADARADVFSLGIVAYELLSGSPPWNVNGLDAMQTMVAIASAPAAPLAQCWPHNRLPVDAAILSRIHRLIHQALEIEPTRRVASALAFAEGLESLVESLSLARTPTASSAPAPSAPAAPSPSDWSKRRVDWARARAARMQVEGSAPTQPKVTSAEPEESDPKDGSKLILVGALVLLVIGALVALRFGLG
ncbi:MAG: serine/threonine protein kinase [Deltaproteobacteria bacterium]|nr:serine/threonine protein kinase [Deltaproteobacteria bacterium]